MEKHKRIVWLYEERILAGIHINKKASPYSPFPQRDRKPHAPSGNPFLSAVFSFPAVLLEN